MYSAASIFELYVCPTAGCIISAGMFAAPINDLRRALLQQSLGSLNPFPWAMMIGNCAGWLMYGYYIRDPFVIASNLPGFVLSFWLNTGASKLQYLELCDKKRRLGTPSRDAESMILVPQEVTYLSLCLAWVVIMIWTGWFYPSFWDPSVLVGFLVNCNLVFFYGAPLKTMRKVIEENDAASIHRPTMIMNWINTGFWIIYGLARRDVVIVTPNAIGFAMGVAQGLLCLLYPSNPGIESVDSEPLIPNTRVD